MKKRTVLITGNAGFIGCHLVKRFLRLGYEVVGIDNLSNSEKKSVDKRVKFVNGDINSVVHIESAFKYKPQLVIHLAANASIVNSAKDPEFEIQNNVIGTLEVLRMCKKYGVKQLLFASSMCAYGNVVSPFRIESPCMPVSVYGVSKYAAERLCLIASGPDLKVTALRMFNVYGPGQQLDNPYQGVVGIFLGNILGDKEIKIFGDGGQTRDFIYIDDVVDAYIKSANEGLASQVLNIGYGKETSIKEIATIISSFKSGLPISYCPGREGEQRYSLADISKTKSLLGWKPKVKLADGLRKTYEWAKVNV